MVRTLAVTLLRHGLTNENVKKKYVGWTDVPLSAAGINELECNKKQGYPQGEAYFISDLKRCKDTFMIIYGAQKQPVFVENFRELNFGRWELKTFEELQHDELYCKWLENYKDGEIPSGENFSDFEKRVIEGWKQATASFLNNHINHIVIISHGGPIRLLLERYAPVERPFWDWPIEHGEGYTLTTTFERIRRNERCISLQEVCFKEKGNGCAPIIT